MDTTGLTQLDMWTFAASQVEAEKAGRDTSASSEWMSSLAVSPAQILAQPGNGPASGQGHSLAYGGNSCVLLASYDPELCCWKMSLGLPTSIRKKWGYYDRLMRCWLLVRCPKSAMTHNGRLYLLPTWERPISANAGSAWPTLGVGDTAIRKPPQDDSIHVSKSGILKYINPTGLSHVRLSQTALYYEDKGDWYTLTANDGLKEGAIELKRENGLSAQVRWATLRAERNSQQNSRDNHVSLQKQVKLWQTPQAIDGKNTAAASRFQRSTMDLNAQVAEKVADKLNPDWCEQLMGFPVGWTDPDAPVSDLTIERVMSHEWPAPPGPQYPHEAPRTTDKVKHRAKRIKALGNGVVPQCVLPIVLAIKDYLDTCETPTPMARNNCPYLRW